MNYIWLEYYIFCVSRVWFSFSKVNDKILNTACQWPRMDLYLTFNAQEKYHILPSWVSSGLSTNKIISKYWNISNVMWNLILHFFICEDHAFCMNVYGNLHTSVWLWHFLNIFNASNKFWPTNGCTQHVARGSTMHSIKPSVFRVL